MNSRSSVRVRAFACLSGLLLLSVIVAADPARELHVDFSKTNGVIRPLHGVNLGPLCYRGTVDLTEYHRALGIPLTRVHDVPWVNAEAVDVHIVFPDFRNDPARPESYRFAATDDYIAAITNTGSRVVYRLGESIEHTERKYFVHPPARAEHWAEICLGIIRHYNQGWANGFRHDIRYWEIWNEPDVRPSMWTGTDEEYFRLYEVTARAIKQQFPEVKVGGPAAGGTGEFIDGKFRPAEFLAKFVGYCRTNSVPLDFLSWHRYTADPWDLPRRGQAIRQWLDAQGFRQTESHLNEWNYLPDEDWSPLVRTGQGLKRSRWFDRMGGAEGAAFAAAGLILLQDAGIDAANFYTGEIQGFGLFSMEGTPKRTYHAFRAFRELLDTPLRAAAAGGAPGEVALLAGVNPAADGASVLMSHPGDRLREVTLRVLGLPWGRPTDSSVLLVDQDHALAEIQKARFDRNEPVVSLALPPRSVVLVRLRPVSERSAR